MTIKLFYGEKSQHKHEYEQIKEIYNLLSDNCEDLYLFTNVLVGNSEIDCILLRRNGPVILELKSFNGIIRGEENGPWEVTNTNGEVVKFDNLFKQLRGARFALARKLQRLREGRFDHIEGDDLVKIQCWGYFKRGSHYENGHFDEGVKRWFDVLTADQLLDKLQFVNSGYILQTNHMDAIASGLRLTEYEIPLRGHTSSRNISKSGKILSENENELQRNLHYWSMNMKELIVFDGNCTSNVSKDAKYSIRYEEGSYVVGLVYESEVGERWYPVTADHEDLVEMVNRVKFEKTGVLGGAFYINEYHQVIVPVVGEKTLYLAGEYIKPLEFEFEGNVLSGDAKRLDGTSLEPGDIWQGPHPGIQYKLAAGNQDIYYIEIVRPRVEKKIMLSDFQNKQTVSKLCRMIAQYKQSQGGRFYINEFQQIFAPKSGESLSYVYIGKLEDMNEWFPKHLGEKENNG